MSSPSGAEARPPRGPTSSRKRRAPDRTYP